MKTKNYVHLTADERYQLSAMRATGQSLRQIAQVLGRHHSTISR
ncbi:MAG: helix-turn-helix domain-containing protein [Gemmatimonadota bacterium]|nr:MAG: helix-turn-helix domain-containing protein [Gemmatimonadota bacterium]